MTKKYTYELDLTDCFKKVNLYKELRSVAEDKNREYRFLILSSGFLEFLQYHFPEIEKVTNVGYSIIFTSANEECMKKTREFYDSLLQKKDILNSLISNVLETNTVAKFSASLNNLYTYYTLEKSLQLKNDVENKRSKI